MSETNKNTPYTCPLCGGEGHIENIVPILEDVRADIVSCQECDAAWRVYYKFQNPSIEIIRQSSESVKENS